MFGRQGDQIPAGRTAARSPWDVVAGRCDLRSYNTKRHVRANRSYKPGRTILYGAGRMGMRRRTQLDIATARHDRVVTRSTTTSVG
jgi:hypothetical protein